MRSVLALGIFLASLAAPAFAGVGEGAPGELRVGFSQLDITPPVGAIMTGPLCLQRLWWFKAATERWPSSAWT
jgi:hypothetical protein